MAQMLIAEKRRGDLRVQQERRADSAGVLANMIVLSIAKQVDYMNGSRSDDIEPFAVRYCIVATW